MKNQVSKKENMSGDQSDVKIASKKSKPNKLSGTKTMYKLILILR